MAFKGHAVFRDLDTWLRHADNWSHADKLAFFKIYQGEDKLSAFTSGAISGDEVWYVRGQINKNYKLSNNLSISPYIYGAGGVAYTNQPTSTETVATAAKSMGIGLEVNGGDNYFFEKNISAKVEISKNWASRNTEDVSDVRLNKHHLLLTMAMRF